MNLSTIEKYDWEKTWDIIISGKFVDNHKFKYKKHVPGEIQSAPMKSMRPLAYSSLLLYDRSAGKAVFLSTDGRGNLSVIKEYSDWNKTWDIITSRELAVNPNHDSILFYSKHSGTIMHTSMYLPRPLKYIVNPTLIKKGDTLTATIYFLDPDIDYKLILEKPDVNIQVCHYGKASGNFMDSGVFDLSKDDGFPAGNWKLHFYVKDEGMFKIKHTENIFII